MTVSVQGALVRAAERLEQGARTTQQALDIEVPRFFHKWREIGRMETTYGAGLDQARRGVAELEAAGAPAQHARDAITRRLDWLGPSDKLRFQHEHSDREVRILPGELRQHARALRLHASIEGTDHAESRAALQTELDELVGRPIDEISQQDALRLASISMLPDDLRPDMPPTINQHWAFARLGTETWPPGPGRKHIAAELDNVRLHRVVRDIVADPASTRAAFDSELRAILALPDEHITPELATRVSIAARLPDHLRPALLDQPRPYGHLPLRNMSSWGYRPSTEGAARTAYDAMRRAVLHERLVADPSFTRERATDELMRILATPDAHLTNEQLVRAATLAGLPEHLRPPLPPMREHAVLGEPGEILRPNHVKGAQTLTAVRMHLADHDPEKLARMLVAADHAGGSIDLELVSVLAKYPGVLDIVGIDAEFLHRQSIQALATAGGTRGADLAASLRVARGVVERHPATDATISKIRSEALELADRNLGRMDGSRTDTFGRHPDYAEVGRFASIATLLHQMRDLAAKRTAAATTSGEQLAW